MIGENNFKDYIRYLRESGTGTIVNIDVAIATMNRMLMSKDANLLSSLNKAWVK